MNKVVIVDRKDGVASLKIDNRKVSRPGPDEVLVRHSYIGVNEVDRYSRDDQHGSIYMGYEGCGVLEEVGDNVALFVRGDRIVYINPYPGAYSIYRIVHKSNLIRIPDGVDEKLVAASFMKGFLAHTVTRVSYFLREGTHVVVHGANSGLGQVLVQFARMYKGNVIGTVKNRADRSIVADMGCVAMEYLDANFLQEVIKNCDNQGPSLVLDTLGKDTMLLSLRSLRQLGVYMMCGTLSGKPSSIEVDDMMRKSLFISAPNALDYKDSREAVVMSSAEVFYAIQQGFLDVQYIEFPLEEAEKALSTIGQISKSVILRI